MRRRTFIAGLGSAAAWPGVTLAQQNDRVRRIGVLMTYEENDPEGKRRYSAFAQALADLGWTDGRNVWIDPRWPRGDRVGAAAKARLVNTPELKEMRHATVLYVFGL
jgi:putative ABC transport system substrate-binding protein